MIWNDYLYTDLVSAPSPPSYKDLACLFLLLVVQDAENSKYKCITFDALAMNDVLF